MASKNHLGKSETDQSVTAKSARTNSEPSPNDHNIDGSTNEKELVVEQASDMPKNTTSGSILSTGQNNPTTTLPTGSTTQTTNGVAVSDASLSQMGGGELPITQPPQPAESQPVPNQGDTIETALKKKEGESAAPGFVNAFTAAFSDLKSLATTMGKSSVVPPPVVVSESDDDSNKIGMRAALLTNLSSKMDESSYIPNITSNDNNEEGLAKQQLLAELREAKNLMAESKQEAAKKFWRDHVDELEARLRTLNGEDTTILTPKPNFQVGLSKFAHDKTTPSQFQGDHQSHSDNLPNAQPASQKMTTAGSVAQYQPPAFKDEEEPPARGSNISRSAFSLKNFIDPSLEGVPMVDVVAPADLPGGYHFEAEIEGRRFLATVPAGGVQKGETFSCYMRDLDQVGAGIPVGRWRDGLFDCCSVGLCHPTIWNALFCPLGKLLYWNRRSKRFFLVLSDLHFSLLSSLIVLLRQILTRVGFDFLGRPTTRKKVNGPKTLQTILGFWIFINIGLFCAYNLKWSQGMELSMADLGAFAFVNIAYIFFLVYLTSSTRGSLREKYFIRESRFHDLEDCCCATFCLPCTLCQMGRHTADYTESDGVCCNDTGLVDAYTTTSKQKNANKQVV